MKAEGQTSNLFDKSQAAKEPNQNTLTTSTYKIAPSDWITFAEASRLRGISRQAITGLVSRHKLPTLNFGKSKLVLKKALLDLVKFPVGRKSG